MGTPAEADVPPISPIPPQDYPSPAAECPPALPLEDVGIPCPSPPPPPVRSGKDPLPHSIAQQDSSRIHSSAAAFVEGGVQDACDDSCSICLEPFCDSDPATVTSCKHDYHLQCILEWAQRSKECPMCWRSLSFEDPNSQELFDAIEQERSPPWARHSTDAFQFHQVPAFATYADFEERIMQHLAHQLARRGSLQNRVSGMHDNAFVHPSNQALLRTTRAILEQPMQEARQMDNHSTDAASHSSHSAIDPAVHGAERRNAASETMEDSQQRSDMSSLSESLKSRFLIASSKWKETFTKTTHGFKEKWRARNNGSPAADFRARAQGVSADVVRQAIRRIVPDNAVKDVDIPTTSSSLSRSASDEDLNKAGSCSQVRCVAGDSHLEGVGASGASHHTPGEAA